MHSPADHSDHSEFDTSRPSPARVYDYFLGGKDNFEVDRDFAHTLATTHPHLGVLAALNRAFLQRTVRFLARQGIRQFIDVGTGLPTQHNVHQVAQAMVPDARVVYVDNDPIVLSHARALLTSAPRGSTRYIDADARNAEKILGGAEAAGIDFSKPVGVLFVAVLHFLRPAEGEATVAAFRAACSEGSYMGISHASTGLAGVASAYRQVDQDSTVRTVEQVAALFGDWEIQEPGVVPVPLWRPHLDRPDLDRPADESAEDSPVIAPAVAAQVADHVVGGVARCGLQPSGQAPRKGAA